MQKIVNAFKDLYLGNDVMERHMCFLILLTLCFSPIILSSVLAPISMAGIILLMGYLAEFLHMKLRGESGLPKFELNLFMKGIKLAAISCVWSIYWLVIIGVFIFTPLSSLVAMSIVVSPLFFVSMLVFSAILTIIALFIISLFGNFIVYIFLDFAEDFELKAKYFNPLELVKYIRVVFKDTVAIWIKVILVMLGVSSVYSIVNTVLFFGIILYSGLFIALIHFHFPIFCVLQILFIVLYFIFIILPVVTSLGYYAIYLVSFVASSLYVDVYKKAKTLIAEKSNN